MIELKIEHPQVAPREPADALMYVGAQLARYRAAESLFTCPERVIIESRFYKYLSETECSSACKISLLEYIKLNNIFAVTQEKFIEFVKEND